MENTFHFQVTTADGAIIDEAATYASIPLADGEYGILPNHAPMIAAVKEGVIKFDGEGSDSFVAVSGGILSVCDNEVIVLARSAELAENIDLARAQASEKRARERIESKSGDMDMQRAEASLHRALAREKAYSLFNK